MSRVAFVLHTHLPYVRRNGTWPCGEDFFHQAATESYLPLIGALGRLRDRGLESMLTVGLTPLVAHQMQDEHMLRELSYYLGRYECRAMRQVANWRGPFAAENRDLATFYSLFGREQVERLSSLGPGGIAGAFGELQRDGAIEIIGGPASHPLLPMITEPALLQLQLATGIAEYERLFGGPPRGMWMPECAVTPGIEEPLAAAGVKHIVVDETATGGLAPVRVGGVTAVPRDASSGRLIWSPGGYPSNEWYRDFHNYDMEAGFKNARITGPGVAVLSKQPYDPAAARERALLDAGRFIQSLERMTADPIVLAFDTELFGHWWFEGPTWLEAVMEGLASHPTLRPATLSQIEPAASVEMLRASTWGEGCDFRSWIAPSTDDMWSRLATAEAETVALMKDHSGPVAQQMLRELLLLQSSDWPYLVVRQTSGDYARQRFDRHYQQWRTLAGALTTGQDAVAEAASYRQIDNAFGSLPAR